MFLWIVMIYLTSDTFSVNQQCQTRVWLNEMTLKIVGEWLDTPTTFWPLWLYVTSKQLAIADCRFCSSVGIPLSVACRVPSSTVNTSQLPLVRHPFDFPIPMLSSTFLPSIWKATNSLDNSLNIKGVLLGPFVQHFNRYHPFLVLEVLLGGEWCLVGALSPLLFDDSRFSSYGYIWRRFLSWETHFKNLLMNYFHLCICNLISDFFFWKPLPGIFCFHTFTSFIIYGSSIYLNLSPFLLIFLNIFWYNTLQYFADVFTQFKFGFTSL